MKILALLLFVALLTPAFADIEDLGDGTYKLTGKFYFNTEKEMLAPWGKENNYGEFGGAVFKPATSEYPGIRELAPNTTVVFTVKGAPGKPTEGTGLPILVVSKILEWEGRPAE